MGSKQKRFSIVFAQRNRPKQGVEGSESPSDARRLCDGGGQSRFRILSLRPNKDYNFDTIRVEVIVLVFYSKALFYKAFSRERSNRVKIAVCFSTEF